MIARAFCVAEGTLVAAALGPRASQLSGLGTFRSLYNETFQE